ncbi:hypothetical protein Tco_0569124 [Tanacetum coccineum]
MSSFNQHGCFGCGGPLDGLLCRRCTCKWCGNNLRNGFCSVCDSGAGNSFVYDSNPNSFNDPPNFFNHPPQPQYDDDDNDDQESTIPLNEIISQIPPYITITPVLPTIEPEDSLNMGDEYLSTIPEKELDEVIKSSVEDLVPIPSESEDTSDNDSECDLPFCDNLVTFSNHLFDSNNDFTSSVDESLLEEDVPEENLNEDECFDSGGDFVLEEIEACPINFEDDYYDSERDIIYLESLLIKDTISNLPPEMFLDRDPISLEDERDKDDLKNIVKVFDPEIHEKIISPTNVRFTFEDRHYFSLTFVIRIFLPYLTYSMDSSFLLSSGSEDTILTPASPLLVSIL